MKTKFAGSEKSVSKIVMGTMIINLNNYADSAALLDAAFKRGVNAFDLAHVYGGGNSERAFGKWMRERGNREDVFVLTKGAHPNADRARVTPEDIGADLMDSLARLQTDYIDVYLLHRDDESKPVGPIVDAFNKYLNAGFIKAFGGSNWKHERIAEANEYARKNNLTPMTATSPNYGLCEQVDDPWGPGCVSISGRCGKEAREFYMQNEIPIFAYSSLGRGLLSGRATRENYNEVLDGAAIKAYVHEINFERLDRAKEIAKERGASVPMVSLAYILSQPFKVFPIVGAASESELDEAVSATEIILTADELSYLENGN